MSNPMDQRPDIDFGDDDDIPMPDDPQFDAWIAGVAPSVNAPTPTPRAGMWEAIQAAGNSTIPPASQVTPVTPLRRRKWYVPAAIAAALLLGISIDRFLLDGRETTHVATPAAQVAATPSTTTPDSSDPSKLYRLAAVQTLTQAEALLTAYRAGNVASMNPAAARQLGTWGRDVLSSTRLLLDSPAGDDPQLRTLLDDLELVLVQIIRLSAPLDSSDRDLIEDAMRDRDLLPRIRTAVPAGDAGTASDD